MKQKRRFHIIIKSIAQYCKKNLQNPYLFNLPTSGESIISKEEGSSVVAVAVPLEVALNPLLPLPLHLHLEESPSFSLSSSLFPST